MPLFKKRIATSFNNKSERRIRQRGPLTPCKQESNEDNLITPEVAAIVVRQYLLPMFESETYSKQKNSLLGSLTDDLHRPLEAISGTVYGELKLADNLMTQLTKAREEINKVTQELKFAEQERQSVCAELENLKKDYSLVTSDLDSMHGQFQETIKKQQYSDLKMSFVNNQVSEYRRMNAECEIENKLLNSALHEEKALNDKRRNTAAELKNGNELLVMENDIMAERLSGLYDELDKLPSRKYVEEKLGEEIEILINSLKTLTEFCHDLGSNLSASVNKRDELKSQYLEIEQLTEEIKLQKEKLHAASKEHINRLTKELSGTVEQREEYRSKLSKLEKTYKDLTESYDKMRQKLKQWKQRGKQFGDHEEKTCTKCRRTFIELENYNWSCKVHTGTYSGDMYWCCGRKGKEAVGCFSSKHMAKNEDEDEELDREKDEKNKYANAKCSSCKEIGHKAHECPKDPNIQGGDPSEDIKRIDEIKKRKKVNAVNNVISQNAINLLNGKFPDDAFGRKEVSSGSEHDFEEEIPEDYVHDPFKDITSLQKMSFGTSENLVSINMYLTKEETEKERGKILPSRFSSETHK